MKNKRMGTLINVLEKAHDDISSTSLAKIMGVSEKTVRNYIKEINQQKIYDIQSSKNGYRLIKSSESHNNFIANSIEYRENYLISKLLANKNGISIFEVSEELSVSESTIINNVLPQIKRLASKFKLSIQSHNYQYSLIGEESQKRKFIGYIATHNNYGYFTSTETLEKLFPSLNIRKTLDKLNNICQQSNLFLNDYSMNNFLIHILIIWIRVQSNNTINTVDNHKSIENIISFSDQKEDIVKLVDQIQSLFADINLTIPQNEYQQIIALITLSIDHSYNNLKNLIEPEFMDNILEIAKEISTRFDIPEFDHSFLIQFSRHMYNAYYRAKINMSYPNPLAHQIKLDYAPVYDMSVYFAHKFSTIYNITLNEDEIAFIAFHFGAYLENNKNKLNTTSCIIICEKYHDFAKNLVSKIKINFQNDLTILDIMSLDHYRSIQPRSDLLITTIQTTISHPYKILINPILTKQNIRDIWQGIEEIEEKKSLIKGKYFLEKVLSNCLYARNISFNSVEEYIRYMGDRCYENHYISSDFIDDVLLRESISSTAFTNFIAIPHTISQYAKSSFIFVIHNDSPINWNNQKINFILMTGIAENDIGHFNDTLNFLIDIFSSTQKTLKIMNTNNFDDFKETLMNL